MPTTYVRVADKETGHHLSIPKARYEADPSAWRELKSDATYADGTPRPPKYKTTVDQQSAEKSGGGSSATQGSPAGE